METLVLDALQCLLGIPRRDDCCRDTGRGSHVRRVAEPSQVFQGLSDGVLGATVQRNARVPCKALFPMPVGGSPQNQERRATTKYHARLIPPRGTPHGTRGRVHCQRPHKWVQPHKASSTAQRVRRDSSKVFTNYDSELNRPSDTARGASGDQFLLCVAVLLEQAAQHSHAAHPEHLEGLASIPRTAALTRASVAALGLCLVSCAQRARASEC